MYKKVLTVQDISCVGQCSMTVALPILSALSLETAVLPSAVLSTHTAGFKGWVCKDLTDVFPDVRKHWVKENFAFDAVYTGYLGSVKQISQVCSIIDKCTAENHTIFVDPAMADNGKLYPAFDDDYVNAMKKLCKKADYIIPNITEACFLTGTEYSSVYDKDYIDNLVFSLSRLFPSVGIILTGVSYKEGTTGVLVYEHEKSVYYRHKFINRSYHGTGDVYSSAFVGAFMQGKSAVKSAKIAADYVVDCIKATVKDTEHWYGVEFEKCLPSLIKAVL